jgi:hypothetical protein
LKQVENSTGLEEKPAFVAESLDNLFSGVDLEYFQQNISSEKLKAVD